MRRRGSRRRTRQVVARPGGIAVGARSAPGALLWGFVITPIIWNRFEPMFDSTDSWEYGYSLTGVVWWLLSQVAHERAVPLIIVILTIGALIAIIYKFLPLITAAIERPRYTVPIFLLVLAITIALPEAIYFAIYQQWFWTTDIVLSMIPPVLVTTTIIAGKSAEIQYAETGRRGVTVDDQPDRHDDPDDVHI